MNDDFILNPSVGFWAKKFIGVADPIRDDSAKAPIKPTGNKLVL